MNSLIRSVLNRFGLFVGRQIPGLLTGYDLPRDLSLLFDTDSPLCFDIGANRGQTIRLLQSCYKRPTIHAFEPASATFTALMAESFSERVHRHHLAMGAEPGVAEFRNYQHAELSSLLPMNLDRRENIFAQEEVVSVEQVQVSTLSQFCQTHRIDQIDLLKIDTQGYELPVLQGGSALFQQKQIKAVLLELNFTGLYVGQSDPLDVMRFLRDNQLQLVDFYEKERIDGQEIRWTTALFVRNDQRTS